MTDRGPITFQLFANFGLLSAAELLAKILSAVAFAVLARVLGPDEYGHLEFTLAMVFFFALFVDSGLSTYGAREIARDATAVGRLAARIVAIRLVLAVLGFGALFGLAAVVQPAAVQTLLVFYGLTLFGIPFLLQWIFQGREMMHYVAIGNLLRWSIFTLAVLLLVHAPGQLLRVAVAEAIAVGAAVIFYLTTVSVRFDRPWQRFDARSGVSSWLQALPIGTSELVWALKIYFATILLGLVYEGSEVAWFGAANRIVVALHAFVWLYFFNLLPAIARCPKGPPAALRRLLATSMRITFPLAVVGGAVAAWFAAPIMTLIFGSAFAPAAAPFAVLVWLVPLALFSGHYRYTLIGYDLQKLELFAAACGATLNVVLNFALVPRFGIQGAAWSLLASETLICAVAYHLVRRRIFDADSLRQDEQ